MIRHSLILLFSCFLSLALEGNPRQVNKEISVKTWLEVKQDSGMVSIQGMVKNTTDRDFRGAYRITTKSGSSQTSQSGEVNARPQQEQVLSTVRLNLQPGDACYKLLSLLQKDKVIAEDSVNFSY